MVAVAIKHPFPSLPLCCVRQQGKHAVDHRGARAGYAGSDIVESTEPDTYSRDLAEPLFTPPPGVNERPLWVFPPGNLPAGANASRSFPTTFAGAFAECRFTVNPSKTTRTAAPRVSNSEFAA